MVTIYLNLKAISEILLEMLRTQSAKYFHTLSPTVTSNIEPWSPKVDMSDSIHSHHISKFESYC